MKTALTYMMEWVRPAGIALALFFACLMSQTSVEVFHILAPVIVMIMAGSIAFEGLVLGEAASAKIGYKADRAYPVQSALANLAIALTALMVLVLNWGKYADATIMSIMLLFLALSGVNHLRTAIREGNLKPVTSCLLSSSLPFCRP